MGYYLDRADTNKQQFEALTFNSQQMNLVVSMMLQCRKLRRRDHILNLFRHSMPDNFDMELIKKEVTGYDGKLRSWLSPLIKDKTKNEEVQSYDTEGDDD